MAKKSKQQQQLEVAFDKPEPFALQLKTTTDGDRVTAEAARIAADKQAAEARQQQIPT